MIREAIGRAATGAQIIAAVLLALAGLRFAITAALISIEKSTPGLPEVVHATSAKPVEPDRSPSAVASVAPVASGESARVTLNISAGPPRSDVFVNGVQRGKTPLLSEVSCKTGATIRIEVIAPRGAPLRYERICKPGTLTLR